MERLLGPPRCCGVASADGLCGEGTEGGKGLQAEHTCRACSQPLHFINVQTQAREGLGLSTSKAASAKLTLPPETQSQSRIAA